MQEVLGALPMAKTRFRPGDPAAIHERFERVRARALRRVEEEFRQIKRLKSVEPAAEPKTAKTRAGRSG